MTAAAVQALRVAVLIDADNVPASILDEAMKDARTRGCVVAACAYSHWTDQNRMGWGPGFRKHGVKEVEQAPGPNATDIALAIDAVDLVHERILDVVCVVSSDRDFAPLAARLRRSRVMAVLMADPAKVKESNRKLWDDFVPLAVTTGKVAKASAPVAVKTVAKGPAAPARPDRAALIEAVRGRFADEKLTRHPGGWALLTDVGRGINKDLKRPSLRKALEGQEAFEIADRPIGKHGEAVASIRLRQGRG